jgi:phosphatidate cytidylyltransferase
MNAPREVYLLLSLLGGVLIVATFIGVVLLRRAKDLQARTAVENLNARIIAWWAMILVAGGACLAGRQALIVLFAIISFCALREVLTIMRTRPGDRCALLTSFGLVLPIQYSLIWTGWYGFFVIFIPVYGFVAVPILTAVSGDTNDFLARTAETQWALMVAVYCISYVPALLMLKVPGFQDRSVLLLVFLLVVVQSSDVLQYISGKLLGRHKIAPHLSPSKTVEGFVGGIVGATTLGASLWRMTPFTRTQAAGMALAIAVTGFLGGLVMSGVKRDRRQKDWGNLIAGHGGLLDRFDSVCFAAPIFFHLTRYFFTP